MMRYLAFLVVTFFLVSCAMDPPTEEAMDDSNTADEYVEMVIAAQNKPEKPTEKIFMEELSHKITERLMSNIDLYDSRAPMVVATPVLANNFQETVSLSHQLQQGLINELHANQFFVVDMNLSDYIKINHDGEFMLSRDWDNIPSNIEVQLVLVSTLVPDKAGISVNTRIVNIYSRRVVASSMVYVKVEQMENIFTMSRTVVSNEEGVLEQNASEGESVVYIIDEYTGD